MEREERERGGGGEREWCLSECMVFFFLLNTNRSEPIHQIRVSFSCCGLLCSNWHPTDQSSLVVNAPFL